MSNEYGYTITFPGAPIFPGALTLEDGPAYAGVIEGSDPRDAARNVVAYRTDILDDTGALAPVFTISRNSDGTFTAEVDTHGLGDIVVDLERA